MSIDSPVLIDVSRLVWRCWRGQLPTGIDRACLAYVEHFRERGCAVIQRGGFTYVLDTGSSERLFLFLLDPGPRFRTRLVRLIAGPVLARRSLPPKSIRGSIYFNVGHTGLDRSGHAQWIERSGVRPVYYVHDLIPITHPQFARSGEPERHSLRMTTVLERAASVIANSDDTISALASFAKAKGLEMPPAVCIPLAGLDAPATERGAPPLDCPYFVTIGTIEGRKNHRLLLRIWRQLIVRLGTQTPKLVIIGQRGWQADDVFCALDSDIEIKPHILELGRCDDKELRDYIAHARALLFPSFVEGQGLPLIEALGEGTPAITSNLGVFREAAGDIPEYIDPSDEEGWRAVIEDYARPNSARRATQIAKMERFHASSWQKHFTLVENELRNILSCRVVDAQFGKFAIES